MENTSSVNNRERLPSDLSQTASVIRYDLLKHLRSKRLLGLLVIEVLILVLMSVLPTLLGVDLSDTSPADYMAIYVNYVDLLLVIGVTMFAGDAIVSEFQNRTGYLLFPNPVKRYVIYLGKLISTVVVITLMIVVYYGVAALATLVITGESTELWVYSMLFAICYGVAAAAVGFFISSLMKGTTGALVLTFFLLSMILSIVAFVLMMADIDPIFVLTTTGSAISGLMTSPYPSDYPDIGQSLLVIMVYTIVLTAAGMLIFKRREMVS
ncbi:MAG: ABC transporter permease [Methanomassiliicoccales archaeon]|nr:ABC transporter permease [Methanomassiliicoccales archaeon]